MTAVREASSSKTDAGLVRALEDYLAELQAGRVPSKTELLAEYPELAEELEECLASLEFVHHVAVTAETGALEGDIRGKLLGDFRLVRRIARGGMGVVLEAEQVSLARRVALKILPFASVLDPKQLQRFKNESMAAAALDHPNIVGIYSVGCELGVHYYAMHYIEGRTLAQVIAQTRKQAPGRVGRAERVPPSAAERVEQLEPVPPSAELCRPDDLSAEEPTADFSLTPPEPQPLAQGQPSASAPAPVPDSSARSREFLRQAARLGVQAAEALEHAHQMGVVHRDIKPSNLMVDASGHLWITDFGLAMIRPGPGLTASGALVGTLRYMSPEQVQGRRVLDHRTDIYSLGATLYELATLHPAFPGDNRESIAQRIPGEEPAAPRQLNRSIPRDLETIVLKAMAKEPEARFASARDLADDLKRFLEDKPIQARRPSLLTRTCKWARRHQAVVLSAVALLCLAVAGLSASTLLIARERQKTTAAYLGERKQRQVADQQRELAQRQERLAEEQQRIAAEQRRLAQEQEREAVNQRDEATRNLYFANMQLAPRYLEQGMIGGLHGLLDPFVPSPKEPDLRGWEWYYFLSQCREDSHTLRGHINGVTCVAWSPDGKRLATASRDKTVIVWDANTGEVLNSFRGDEGQVHCVCWSPDGLLLASGGETAQIIVWDVMAGEQSLVIRDQGGSVWSIAWSPDGRYLASCRTGPGGPPKIWDAATGRLVRTFTAHQAPECVAWSADSRRLVSSGGDATARIWDVETGREILKISGAGNLVYSAWSKDNRFLATDGPGLGNLCIWDTATGKQLKRISPDHGINLAIAWSPSGQQLATSYHGSDLITVWDTKTWQAVRELRGHTAAVWSLAWSPDGRRLTSAGDDTTVRVWDLGPRVEANPLGMPAGPVLSVQWSPDRRLIAAAHGQHDPAIRIWDPATGRITRSLPGINGKAQDVAWSPDGKRLAAVAPVDDLTVKTWDVSSGRESGAFMADLDTTFPPGDRWLRRVCWGPDGNCLAARSSREVLVWQVSSGKLLLREKSTSGFFRQMDWIPSNGSLAFTKGRYVLRWNARSAQKETLRFEGLRQASGLFETFFSATAPSPDGKRLAAAWMTSVRIYDLESGKILGELRGQTNAVDSLCWSPDGRRLAMLYGRHAITIWDPRTCRDLLTLAIAENNATRVAWSPDGRQLIAYLGDRIRVWDAAAAYREVQPAVYRQRQAERLLNYDRVDEAVELLEKTAAEYPTLPDYRPFLASQLAMRRHPMAENLLKQLIAQSPDNAEYQRQWAEYLGSTDRLDEAIQFAERMAKSGEPPQISPALIAKLYAQRAASSFEQEQWKAAADDFSHAIRLEPTNRVTLLGCARAYQSLGDAQRAIDAYGKAIRAYPYSAEAYASRGHCYRLGGHYAEAVRDYEEALRRDPGQTEALCFDLAFCKLMTGDAAQAIHALNHAQSVGRARDDASEAAAGATAQPAHDRQERGRADSSAALRAIGELPVPWLEWLADTAAYATLPRDGGDRIRFCSDLPWVKSTSGAKVMHIALRDNNVWGDGILVGTMPCAKGIWTHSLSDGRPADVVLDTASSQFETFRSVVGMAHRSRAGSVQFQVLLDDAVAAETPVTRAGTIHRLDVKVGGAKRIVLRVLNGGDGFAADHAAWGYARLIPAGAADPLEEPVGLRSSQDAALALLVAVVRQRLRHVEQARRWYDQAVKWIDENKPGNEELLRFRDEAAELLGVREKRRGNGE